MPLGVRVEDADGDVGAEHGEEDDSAESLENPGGIDEVDHLGWSGAALGVVAGCLAGRLWGDVGLGGLRILRHGSQVLGSHVEQLREEVAEAPESGEVIEAGVSRVALCMAHREKGAAARREATR